MDGAAPDSCRRIAAEHGAHILKYTRRGEKHHAIISPDPLLESPQFSEACRNKRYTGS